MTIKKSKRIDRTVEGYASFCTCMAGDCEDTCVCACGAEQMMKSYLHDMTRGDYTPKDAAYLFQNTKVS